MQDKEEIWGIENTYIDSAAAQVKADLAYEYEIYCENSVKSVNDGIAFVQNLIEKGYLQIDEIKCWPVYQALSSYRWNPKTETQKPIHDACVHYCDAVRYAIYSHSKTKIGLYYSDDA